MPEVRLAAKLVTPVLLTWNEAPNIRRTLEGLRWARKVVVLDSGSTDGTESMAREFPNVEWHARKFDAHGAQWEHAIRKTGIETPYALALDADMVVTDAMVAEMEKEVLGPRLEGGELTFRMVLGGEPLWGDIYPAQIRLFRVDALTVAQRGHTQVFECDGRVHRFRARVDHDDRKGCDAWLLAQTKYSNLEAQRILSGKTTWKDRLRRWGVMPIVAGMLGYLAGGGPFTRGAAWRYAQERAVFEMMLGLRLLRERQTKGDAQ